MSRLSEPATCADGHANQMTLHGYSMCAVCGMSEAEQQRQENEHLRIEDAIPSASARQRADDEKSKRQDECGRRKTGHRWHLDTAVGVVCTDCGVRKRDVRGCDCGHIAGDHPDGKACSICDCGREAGS